MILTWEKNIAHYVTYDPTLKLKVDKITYLEYGTKEINDYECYLDDSCVNKCIHQNYDGYITVY